MTYDSLRSERKFFMTVRIGIVEDSAPISNNWVKMLDAHAGFRCVGAFRTGEDALQKLPALRPDVVLMDVSQQYVEAQAITRGSPTRLY